MSSEGPPHRRTILKSRLSNHNICKSQNNSHLGSVESCKESKVRKNNFGSTCRNKEVEDQES